jgi:predicted ribosomally synthesized peptide with nif11-like leader
MLQENSKKSISEIDADPDTKSKIAEDQSVQEVTDILMAAGYQLDPVDIGDFKAAVQSYMPNLSDEELEAVASGTFTPTVTTLSPTLTPTATVLIK